MIEVHLARVKIINAVGFPSMLSLNFSVIFEIGNNTYPGVNVSSYLVVRSMVFLYSSRMKFNYSNKGIGEH